MDSADDVGGSQDEDEGDGVAEQDADEEDVAELSAGRLHDGSVVVSNEHAGHQKRDYDSWNSVEYNTWSWLGYVRLV